jgi:signal transduction histidine kinase/CheY-like chemotaxis protein
MQPRAASSRHVAIAAALCAAYALNLWLTNLLRVEAGGVDTIWTANAFVIAAVLLLPARWTAASLASGLLIQASVISLFGHALFDALGYALLNVLETLAVVVLARRLNAVRLTTPGRFAKLVFLALLPVLLAGTALVGFVVLLMSGHFPAELVLNRLAAKFLGMSLVLPALLFLGRAPSAEIMRPRVRDTAAAFLLAGGLASAIFTTASPIAAIVLFPVMTLLGLWTGPRVATLTMTLVSAVLFTLGTTIGPPAGLAQNLSVSQSVTLAQVYLAMLFATGIIPALMATHQLRLRRILLRRSASDRRARALAEAASVAKTDFLATMSHEIRTPLNSILGFAEVLERRSDLSAEGRHHVGLIRRSGDALLTVVNDILDFSKVEAGRLELDPKPTDVAGACRDALTIIADSAERKGLTLTMTTQGEIAPAYACDDHRLVQVLLNLLNNAVKFTDVGGISLVLSAVPDGASDQVRIAVSDTGIGIADTSALFRRFAQIDSSVSRNYGGTGLGLAICRGLIEAMGGTVGVESAPGQGSTFWLELRLDRADLIAQGALEAGEPADVGAHVLLVDDHPMNRELGVTLLTLLGCTADVACDGREAIAAAQARRYDAILMDVHMPELDGLAATRAIRALPSSASRTPIIAMSADVLPDQLSRMWAAGMVANVEKPIDIAKLHACLAEWIGKDSTGAEIAA